ncbi:MAG: histidine kinase [Candidatus Eisenbacteria bacterium]
MVAVKLPEVPLAAGSPDLELDLRLVALLFEGLVTLALAAVHLGLWRARREPFHASWSAAWALYAVRLAAISAFLVDRRETWLFAHQAITLISAMLLCWAALQFLARARWRRVYLVFPIAAVAWAAFAVFGIHDMGLAGASSAVLLSLVTLGTGAIFWRQVRRNPSAGATLLAWAFTVWGVHHLDYPILRAQGSGLFYGVFVDVACIVAVAVGVLALVLHEQNTALVRRASELELLSQRLLSVQEEERRRIARELHDGVGQTLTAAKIGLDLDGRTQASQLVADALAQVRDLSELLQPRVLDELGLLPALRALAEGLAGHARLELHCELDASLTCTPEQTFTLYRVAQEALTNVVRHSQARGTSLIVTQSSGWIRMQVSDDGHGFSPDMKPHLGLLGMRERLSAVHGRLTLDSTPQGTRLIAEIPVATESGR